MKNKSGDIAVAIPMSGYIVFDYSVQQMEGRLLTFIEAMGLPQGQEKAAKDIVRNELYSIYRDSLFASPEVVEKAEKEKEQRLKDYLPVQGRN